MSKSVGAERRSGVERPANEWVRATNYRSRYWLHAAFLCKRVPDPFGRLLARAMGAVRVNAGKVVAVSTSPPPGRD